LICGKRIEPALRVALRQLGRRSADPAREFLHLRVLGRAHDLAARDGAGIIDPDVVDELQQGIRVGRGEGAAGPGQTSGGETAETNAFQESFHGTRTATAG
jgi:hypothetical protein